jgi:hypothetical protein
MNRIRATQHMWTLLPASALAVTLAVSGGTMAGASEDIPAAPSAPPTVERFGVGSSGLTILSLADLPDRIRERAVRVNEEYRHLGYHLVGEAEIDRYTLANLSTAFVPGERIEARLSEALKRSSAPSSIHALEEGSQASTRAFGKMTLEGVIPVGPASSRTVYGVNRVFSLANGSLLLIGSTDYTTGQGAAVPAEAINAEVNGFPAIANMIKSPSGRTVAFVSWFTDTHYYTVYKTGAAGEETRAKLLALARNME